MKVQLSPGRRFVIGVPYLWLLVFFVLPFAILLRISVTDLGSGVDPFAPLIDTSGESWRLVLQLQNYLSIFSDASVGGGRGQTIYIEAFQTSLKYAALTTLLCLIVGYPFAYFLARARAAWRPVLLMLELN